METEREELPQTRLFWVALTVFGSMFATGLFIIFQSLDWGLFDTIVGLVGLIVLVRDRAQMHFLQTIRLPRLPAVSVQTLLLLGASVAISIFVGHTISQVVTTQNNIAKYVLPRSLTATQTSALADYLSHHKSYSVTVKVDPLDQEALQYAGQLLNAMRGTNWTAEMSTSSQDPSTLNPGLCIDEMGLDSRPTFDPKEVPVQVLQQAFQAAGINVSCTGGAGRGTYTIYLLIGRRPLVVGEQTPLLVRLGTWIASWSE